MQADDNKVVSLASVRARDTRPISINTPEHYKKLINASDVLSKLMIDELLAYRGDVRSFKEETSTGVRYYYNPVVYSEYDAGFDIIKISLLLNSGEKRLAIAQVTQIVLMKLLGYEAKSVYYQTDGILLYPTVDDFINLDWNALVKLVENNT